MAYEGTGSTSQPLTSNAAGTLPSYGTLVVAGGGTGLATTTAYGVICGGTTSTGNFQNAGAGSSGQVLTSNGGAALPSFKASSGVGNLVLLSSQSASGSASLVFTSLISASYNTYLLVWSNVQPATNGAKITMKVSTNNGSTYLATGYQSGIYFIAYNNSGTGISGVTTDYDISTSIDNTSFASGQLWLTNTGNGATSQIYGNSTQISGGITYAGIIVGTNTATSVNAFQIIASSGNITSGTFTLYGLFE